MNNRFTLSYAIATMADQYIQEEKKKKGSIVGNLVKYIEKKNKLRDAQRLAINIYLWLKEVGKSKKLSELIKSGKIFPNNVSNILYPSDSLYLDKPSLRYLNRYFHDIGMKNKDTIFDANTSYQDVEKIIDNLFEDFDYTNYLFSLPMGSGKTFLMAAFIYIDLYMYEKTKDNVYAQNFIIIAPSARKTAILPSLKTIKLFNPNWIIPTTDAQKLKRNIRIEVLDEIPNADKLQNQNPNLAKINRVTNGHSIGNVFILNAEKVIPNSDLDEAELEKLTLANRTKIKRSYKIKEALSNLQNIEIFLDEAHHTYSNENETKKLREQINVINANNNIVCCIGMSGTPYVDRKIKINNKIIKLQDIQDIVYYYPLTTAIGNFLKTPIIKKVDSDTSELVKMALNDFFKNFDITYKNGTKSKIAFYCSSIEALNTQILPIINEWYDDNSRDKSEILKYYTDTTSAKKYPIPKENLTHFLNLDNPTSKNRVVLLVSVGTEGWDCRSLTSVVLPRQKTSKNFVLQTTCRCLREVDFAQYEKALIYLDGSNYATLNDELKANYHLQISDITSIENNYKDYPVYSINNNIGKIKYKNIYNRYVEIGIENSNKNIANELEKYDFNDFKNLHPYTNQIGTTTISESGLDEQITYNTISNQDVNYTFVDFLYDLEYASLGGFTCSKLIEYKSNLLKIYNQITTAKNLSWIINHPSISMHDVCKNIVAIFATKVECKREQITDDVEISILDWNLENKPTVRIYEDNKENIFPENSYDDIEGLPEYYEDDIKELKRRYEDKMKVPNKEKSFNYLPYRMDSSYEYNFLKKVLQNITGIEIEIYYNGYKNSDLNSVKIITPYGNYTPDFVIIKRNKIKGIEKILLVETKADPYITKAKEEFVKKEFLKNNPNFDYMRIGNVEDDYSEYAKMLDKLVDFAIK